MRLSQGIESKIVQTGLTSALLFPVRIRVAQLLGAWIAARNGVAAAVEK